MLLLINSITDVKLNILRFLTLKYVFYRVEVRANILGALITLLLSEMYSEKQEQRSA
jgi:hypothetical protein